MLLSKVAVIPIIVVIGAGKCGITSTCRFLVNQAGIVAPTPKQSDLPSFITGRAICADASNWLYMHDLIFSRAAYLAP